MLAIRPREGEQGWQRYGAYLWSERKYTDFILDLEYAYPKGGNSGVYFRVGDRADPVNKGIEAQILDSSKKEGEMSHHDHGGIISTIGASRNMSRAPGEWNRMIVTVRGVHLTVDLNGAKIVDVQLDKTAVKGPAADGLHRTAGPRPAERPALPRDLAEGAVGSRSARPHRSSRMILAADTHYTDTTARTAGVLFRGMDRRGARLHAPRGERRGG